MRGGFVNDFGWLIEKQNWTQALHGQKGAETQTVAAGS